MSVSISSRERRASCCVLAAVVLPMVALAFDGDGAGSDLDAGSLFGSRDTLELSLTLPLAELLSDRRAAERPYRSGELILMRPAEDLRLPLRVRVVGKLRAAICDLPPMKFRFDAAEVAGTPLAGHEQLYFTPRCRRQRGSDQELASEHLAYEIFRLVTPMSYQVRLARVTVVDRDDMGRQAPRFLAMLTEHQDSLARRLALQPRYPPSVRREDLVPEQAALVSLFQFMIGNTDYSLIAAEPGAACCHNTQLIGDGRRFWPVPYDFDQSGAVNADYAMPPPSLPIQHVTQRFYRGLCEMNGSLPEAIARFDQARGPIVALLRDHGELRGRTRRRLARFFDGFYELLADPDEVQRLIVGRCH